MSRKATVLVIAVVVFTVWNVAARAEVVAPNLAPGWYGGAFPKNRYIYVDPTADGANLGKTFAIHVTLTDSLQFADAAGMTWWVGAPDENCMAGLVDARKSETGTAVLRFKSTIAESFPFPTTPYRASIPTVTRLRLWLLRRFVGPASSGGPTAAASSRGPTGRCRIAWPAPKIG